MRRLLAFALALFAAVSVQAQTAVGPIGPTGGGDSLTIITGTTAFSSGTDCFAYGDASRIVRCSSSLLGYFDAGAGDAVFTLRRTMSGASATNNFFNLTGTFPASTSQTNNAFNLRLTGAGSSAFPQNVLNINLLAGYTGAANTVAVATNNASAGTGTSNPNIGVAAQTTGAGAVGVGAYMAAVGTTTNSGYGGVGLVQTNGTPQAGLVGYSGGSNLVTHGSGLLGVITNGFVGDFNTTLVPYIIGRSALSASNANTTYDVFKLFDDTTEVFAVGDGGNYRVYRTVTAAGTTGARTIDKPAGCVNFAAAATTLVVTNALATTTSIVLATAQANDATCSVKDIERAAGSFTIRMTAACTGETAVCYLLTN